MPEQPARQLDPAVPVLYVLESGGIADRLALASAARRHGLPAPGEPLRYGDVIESSRVDILKPKPLAFAFTQRLPGSTRRKRLVQAGLDPAAGELQVVPVSIYWGRAPRRGESLLRDFFSEQWHIAGRTRKFLTVLVHGRNTLLWFSRPLSLRMLIGTNGEIDTLEHKLTRVLRVHFRQRRIASLGPDLSHRRTLLGHVVADRGVRRAIDENADGTAKQRRRLEQRAWQYAQEIATDVSYPAIRMYRRLLKRLWHGLYEGVDLQGIERLQAVVEGNEIIYVPCHRSHIDYLLLSYILYERGYSLPHVAAGLNLNLPLVGRLLRRGGAFFLRRSFSGNRLYAAVFNAYLMEIQQRGHAIEYFIEGGRSRTGRLLPAKPGMLAMTAHAYLLRPHRPVVFVPVYFGYERLLEGRAFVGELAGGRKQQESVFALLKSLGKLKDNYGTVHVNFGEPVALHTLLDKHCPHWGSIHIDHRRPAWLTPLIDELGVLILQRINAAASVTPVSLLAAVLLASPRGALGIAEVHRQIKLYRQLLVTTTQGGAVVVPPINTRDAIDRGVRLGFIARHKDALGSLVNIIDGQASPLTYFRNNIVHLFVLPALVASCFTHRRHHTTEAICELVIASYPFLQADFFLPDLDITTGLTTVVDALVAASLLRRDPGLLIRPPAGSDAAVSLERLAGLITPILERYYLSGTLLARSAVGGVDADTLAGRSAQCAARLATIHGRLASDLHDRHSLACFIDTLARQELIARRDGVLQPRSGLLALRQRAELLISGAMRQAILNASLVYADDALRREDGSRPVR